MQGDEEIRLLKEGQTDAKKEAVERRAMIESLMTIFRVSDAKSNSTTPTSHALG